ncbi:PREDICTED: ejaculatory bulb-specific protein 3-like [Dinoponera quadriceps]|uniref:Ejaculatory bulb-specific protein 3-like n=1 Tax=Dinoponera quadriceps TaxID=609295 RepID=A0A6P3XDN3_DINQU|nr:PREDICTED: ejaculatory bulb-specific protein 3-like [Dinoponera quadriceps]
MKFAFVLLFGLMFGLVTGTEEYSGDKEYYSSTYDNVDVDAILSSERLLKQYLECILDNGPCTADARNLKYVLPEAVATRCEKCTLAQKQMARKISFHLKEYKPDTWLVFVKKFDPNGIHITAFEDFLKQQEE